MPTIDLEVTPLRDFNQTLHDLSERTNDTYFRVLNPRGRHAIAAGIDAPVSVEIDGHVGYYCAGMNKRANIVINGSAGVGVAENMMSGRVHVKGDASASAGATGCGGLLRDRRQRLGRCGISPAASTSWSRARSATCRPSWRRPALSWCSAMPATRSATSSTRRAFSCAAR